MNSEVKDALKKALKSMLAEAGLPEESELIGRKFAFTYTNMENREPSLKDMDFVHRVSGTVLGVRMNGYNLKNFNLATTPLLERDNWTWDTNLRFDGDNHKWSIYLFHSDRIAGYQSNRFNGEFELL